MSNRGSPPAAPAFISMPYENRFQRTSRKTPQGDYSRHKSGIGGIWENGNGVSRYGGCRVIWFDHDGDPYECIVRRIQLFGEDLHLVVEDKHSHDLYEIDGPFELGARCINWLDEILRTTVQLLSGSNTKTK